MVQNPLLMAIPQINSPDSSSSSGEDNEIVIINELQDSRNSTEQMVKAMRTGLEIIRLKEIRVKFESFLLPDCPHPGPDF